MSTIVIGASTVGLTAAHDIRAAGKSVIVREARNRMDDGLYTNPDFAGIPVALGAEFIFGDLAPT